MSNISYLFFHKDHPLYVRGVNSGAENATRDLACALARAGKRVIVCGQLPEGDQTVNGVEYCDLGASYDVEKAFKRAEEIGPFVLIAACRAFPILASRNNSNCIGRYFIAHDPSSGATGIDPKILTKELDGIICVSSAQAEMLAQGGFESSKIRVIPNGADQKLFHADKSVARDLNKIVFVGALVSHKGIDILINAFLQSAHLNPNATLDIYGSSSLWGQAPLFDEKEISDRFPQVRFFGARPQEEIARAFQTAGMCVIPSRWFDCFPLTAVEAQVSGCPVVAFDVGGVREAFVDGKSGILIPEVSEEALVSVIQNLLTHPEKLSEMSKAAEAFGAERFDWNKTAAGVIDFCEAGAESTTIAKKRIGFLSTWNQQCGLATYQRFMLDAFEAGSYVVFAEETLETISPDEPFVRRTWRRGSEDFGKLFAAIKEADIGVLQLNCHYRFFPQPAFKEFIEKLKASGIKVTSVLHNLFTFDEQLKHLVQSVDTLFVHSPENKLEAIANGAAPESVFVVPHGVHAFPKPTDAERKNVRELLGCEDGEKLIVTFGFIQPHKGIEGLIEGIAYLNQRGIPARAIVAGKPHEEDQNGKPYLEALQARARELNVGDKINFLNTFVPDSDLGNYMTIADAIVLNYRSQHYEASGVCSLAVGAGVPVITSVAPPFAPFHDAVFHSTTGYPIPYALEALFTDASLRNELLENARRYTEKHSWNAIRTILTSQYKKLGCIPTVVKENKVEDQSRSQKQSGKRLRVLINNRPTTFTHRGGDTVVLERLVNFLEKNNVDVSIDLQAQLNPSDFDIVHIFNFALPDMVKFYGERARNAERPFVITTLLEDIPSFHNQSHFVAAVIQEYVEHKHSQEWFKNQMKTLATIPASERFENSWAAKHAAALFTNGEAESETIRRDYGNLYNIREIKLGYEIGKPGNAAEFERQFGIKDFVLCVGRLESRKNQLMLLKALENEDIPVVLAGGGFSYQPGYAEAVQKFSRKGRTIILPRLTDEQLANAYAAAKVHALPSWYELPGLVSLEAAHYGCAVVVSDRGTTRDYLGDEAYYCNPDNPDSIRSAVLAAFYAPPRATLKELVMKYSWEDMAKQTLSAYQEISGWQPQMEEVTTAQSLPQFQPEVKTVNVELKSSTTPDNDARVQELFEKGELIARDGKFDAALEIFSEVEKMGGVNNRISRAKAVIYLAQEKIEEARPLFERAISFDSLDGKSICGLGMCAIRAGDRAEAINHFVKALDINPEHTVAILQLMECSYALNQYGDLEKVLRRYTNLHPQDIEMEFCLAGCLFKLNRFEEAEAINGRILAKDATHKGGLELKRLLEEEKAARPIPLSTAVEVERTPTSRSDLSSVSKEFNRRDEEIIEIEELKRQKSYSEAATRCDSLLGSPLLTPSQRENAQCLRAELYVMDDDLTNAAKLYEEVLSRNAQNARALCGRGALEANTGNWAGAEQAFANALAERPEYDVALAGLGICASQKGNSEVAWNYYLRSHKSNPENSRALLGMIETGYALKRLTQVEDALKTYLELHPADLDFMYSLAGCCYAQGKAQEALEAIQTITLFNPSHKLALELQSMIENSGEGARV